MGDETPAGLALGTLASVLFVVSYVPQIRAIGDGDTTSVSRHMFALQLVSGAIWIAYGGVERSTSILAFGILSTTLRLVILRALLCGGRGGRREAGGTVVLAGGGALPSSVWRCVATGAAGREVVVVAWAEEDAARAAAKEREARRRLWWAGCRTTTDTSRLARAEAVWFVGGNTTRLLRRLDEMPGGRRALCRIVQQGGMVGGTSAGAIALGSAGVGLVPWHVCAHARRAGDYCLDEGTAVVLVDGRMRTVGRGGVAVVAECV